MSGVLVTVIYIVFMCAFVECQNDTQHVGNKTTADVVVDATTRAPKIEAESNSTLTPTATSTANTEAESKNAEKSDDHEHAITNDISILQNLNTSHEATTTTTAMQEEDMLARLGEEDSETTNSTTSHVTRTAHVQTTTEDNCEEDCDEKRESVENAENVTEPSKKEEDECMAYFQELIEKHDLLRRKLKGQLAEHDIDHECHFEARAKRVFHKFYDQTFHLLPAHDAENDNGSHNDHPSLLFKRALTMKLYSQIAHVYLDALRHRNITLSRSLENLILEVVTRTKQALHGHCYDKAYMENCQDIVKKVWHPFIQSIKMESAAKHEHLARFFFE
uniref:Uncharacterized protein n=1 Tax=Romanomermis culicivorax TaxID=13658 RepID=A0A915ICL1_ROMCU